MDKTKKIKFDFQDDGSLEKLRANYEKFANELAQKAKNFGGNNTQSQAKYIKDEVEYYKQLFDAQKKVFDQKRQDYQNQEIDRRKLEDLKSKGKISDEDYKYNLNDLNKRRRDLLSGTGRRTFANYEKDATASLNATGGNVNRLEKLMENSNFILREILGQDREEALKTIKAIEKDKEASPEEKLAASMAKDRLENNKPDSKTKSILDSLFTFQNLNNLLSRATGTLTANSGLEATKNLSAAAKEGVITVADIAADLAETFLGKKSGSLFKGLIKGGARVAGAAWDVTADDKFSAFEARQDFDLANFRNRGLIGRGLANYTLSNMGYGLTDVANANFGVSRSMGTSKGSELQTLNALKLERGFGIDQTITNALLELARTNKDTDKNLINIVGGIYSSGKQIFNGDRTFLGEFISKNFTGLQRELLRNQASVRSGTVMDVLSRFDKIGGQWDARNPNSMGLISSINNSLTNPSGDNMDALTFMALRKQMPGAGILDILKEREKGVGSSNYLQGVFNQLDLKGGSKDFQVINLAKAFGINYNAADELYTMRQKNPNMFANMSQKDLQGVINGLDGMGEANTTLSQSQAARLNDSQIEGNFGKMFELIKQMGEIIDQSFNGATYTIDPVTRVLTVTHPSSTATKTPPVNKNTTPAKSAETTRVEAIQAASSFGPRY